MKVNQAKVCLSCDEIYVGQCCPICLESKFLCLRDYFKPLISSQEIKEAMQNGTYPDSLQMVTKKKCADHIGAFDSIIDRAVQIRYGGDKAPTSQPSRFAPDYSPEPPTTSASKSDHPSGVRMESESGIKQGGNRTYASFASLWKDLRRNFKVRIIRCGEEYTGRVQDSVNVSR